MQRCAPFARFAVLVALVAVPACGDGPIPFSGGSESPVADVDVSPDEASVDVGESQPFSAVALNSDGDTLTDVTFSWVTGQSAVATVNDAGLATGRGGGNTPVIARSGGVADSATLTVIPSPR